jgi:hypothetical protein
MRHLGFSFEDQNILANSLHRYHENGGDKLLLLPLKLQPTLD